MVSPLGFWSGIRESTTHYQKVEEEETILWVKPVTFRALSILISFRVVSDHRTPVWLSSKNWRIAQCGKKHMSGLQNVLVGDG